MSNIESNKEFEAEELIRCVCTAYNYTTSNYCLFCGRPVGKCPHCEKEIVDHMSNFCTSCGEDLKKEKN
jgi:hypothetical protein